jgi:hypothetical protein
MLEKEAWDGGTTFMTYRSTSYRSELGVHCCMLVQYFGLMHYILSLPVTLRLLVPS